MQDHCQKTCPLFALITSILMLLFFQPALAEDEIEKKELPIHQELKILNGQVRSLAAELLSDLGSKELQAIYDIRANYGIVKSVRVVHADVTKGVQTCLESNDDMDKLEASYKQWANEIDPIVEKASADLEAAVDDQKIVDSSRLRLYLATINKIADVHEKTFAKKYVTDRKACQQLGERLDDTKKGLVQLLNEGLKKF